MESQQIIKNSLPSLGAHTGTARGLVSAIERAKDIGAEAIQIFGASPRQWSCRLREEKEVKKYLEELPRSNLRAVYLHAGYLVNLASPNEDIFQKSIENLAGHLAIAEQIKANGLIFHVGSGLAELPKDEAIYKAARAMRMVLDRVSGHAFLVIENAAGGGEKLGAKSEDIGKLLELVKSPRVKICFDTAHAFEAGLIESYTPENIKKLFDDCDKTFGLANLVALHVNDSKTAFNSKHDRHENIGEGFIGLDGFKNLARETRLYDKAWLLEVPGFDNLGPDKKNMDILKSCFGII